MASVSPGYGAVITVRHGDELAFRARICRPVARAEVRPLAARGSRLVACKVPRDWVPQLESPLSGAPPGRRAEPVLVRRGCSSTFPQDAWTSSRSCGRCAHGHREHKDNAEDPQEDSEHLEFVSAVRSPDGHDPRYAGRLRPRLGRLDARHFHSCRTGTWRDRDDADPSMRGPPHVLGERAGQLRRVMTVRHPRGPVSSRPGASVSARQGAATSAARRMPSPSATRPP